MFQVRKTEQFNKWLLSLRDNRARERILTRLLHFQQGNLGDVKPVGEGVSEARFIMVLVIVYILSDVRM